MAAPDKIYVSEYQDGYYSTCWNEKPHVLAHELESIGMKEVEYIRKDALMEWINAQQEKLWELLPDADNDNPTQMELRHLGQYMQLEAMEDKLNEM